MTWKVKRNWAGGAVRRSSGAWLGIPALLSKPRILDASFPLSMAAI